MKPNFFAEAVVSLAKFNFHSVAGEEIIWKDGFAPPSIQEIKAEAAKLEAEYNSKEYQRNRAAEYPPITDYIDGVVKGDQAQIDKYIADCLATKAKYPKGVA